MPIKETHENDGNLYVNAENDKDNGVTWKEIKCIDDVDLESEIGATSLDDERSHIPITENMLKNWSWTIDITNNRQLRRVRRIFRRIRQQGKRHDQKRKKIRQKEIEALKRWWEFIDPVDKEKFENFDEYINEMLKGEYI